MNYNFDLKLYHGTDARLISMSESERCEYLSDCQKVIDYLWDIYKPYYHTQEEVEAERNGNKIFIIQRKLERYKNYIIEHSNEALWQNLDEKLMMLELKDIGNKMYQYGGFYLTGDKNKAIRYAYSSFAGGEIGLIAYRLIQGIEILGWIDNKKQDEIHKLIDKIKSFAQAEHQPVVLRIKDIDIDNLLLENGRPVEPDDFAVLDICSFKFNGKYDLSVGNFEYVSLEFDRNGSPCFF